MVGGLSIGAAESEVALVFDQSVMDLPDYDCTSIYPNLPIIPLDKLNAVLVRDNEQIPRARKVLEKHDLHAKVVTRDEYTQSTYGKFENK